MNIRFSTTALIITLFPSYLSADISGQIIAFNCYSCHGEGLKNLSPSKKSSKEQLLSSLLAFKRDTQAFSVMNRISKGYTDDELASVSAYIKNASEQTTEYDK